MQLYKFLKPAVAQSLLSAITAADQSDGLGYMEATEFTVGVRGGWQPVGPPHRHRYVIYVFRCTIRIHRRISLDDARIQAMSYADTHARLRCWTRSWTLFDSACTVYTTNLRP